MSDPLKGFQDALAESRQRRRRRRRMATLIFVLLVCGGYGAARITPLFDVPEPRPEKQVVELPPSDTCRDVLCQIPWPRFETPEDGPYDQWVEDHRVVYTLDPELQEEALAVLRRYNVHYGAFVALEPASGKVLALAEYSRHEPELEDFCRRATYPAASIIKIVTAVAALETGEVEPETRFRFEGSPYRLYPRKISPNNRHREHNVHTVAEALGKSNNVVFGKLGADVVGARRLEQVLKRFWFNRRIPFDFRLQRSSATVGLERYPLARTAAGFGEVYLSPIHAALLAATIGNGGVMMQPYVVDRIEGRKGNVLYQAAAAPLARSTTEAVADTVANMMTKTVDSGTSAKVFYRYARKLRNSVGVAGKTGSLSGSDPPGRYEWFVGFAPVKKPKIAVASLIVNRGDLWHIKGTYTAQAVMREFFGM